MNGTSVELNQYFNSENAWTRRLLGLENFAKHRDIHQVEREYNQDKYYKLAQADLHNMQAYRELELELAGIPLESANLIYSIGDALYDAPVSVSRNMYYELIRGAVSKFGSSRICELGCGYGYNLTLFDGEVYGGEYSANAVNIARKLGLDVQPFNYYEGGDYDLIRSDSTIFTSHSIEQIPDATVIVENLRKHKEKINYVVHIEPTIVKERSNLLGLMRNKYIELNDYNRNLIELLRQAQDVEILELRTDVFGFVPLNSSNVIAWRFR
ncbi:MAG: hypothetical protein ACKVOR_06150 [Flavobacteriales bacterium]